MALLLKNAWVFSPEDLGQLDLLLAGGQIVSIEPTIDLELTGIEVVDLNDKIVVPGFVDSLTHITGGGGEGGFATRTPEMLLSHAILAGITTVTGALGTDSVSRSHGNLLAKAKGLKAEGLSVYCHTGSYQVPVRTLMGSIEQDLMYIEEFIGVGEVAISDHRSSQPTVHELARIAAEAKVGGMIGGKKGMVSIHVGAENTMLEPLWHVCDRHDVRLDQFYPTHINRNARLLDAGVIHAGQGGYIDFTASFNQQWHGSEDIPAAEAVVRALDAGADPERMTISTDGHASLPVFDANKNLIGLEAGSMDSLYQQWRQLIQHHGLRVEQALLMVTANPANILGLKHKGSIAVGQDADLLVLTDDYQIDSVIARGQWMLKEQILVRKGYFE